MYSLDCDIERMLDANLDGMYENMDLFEELLDVTEVAEVPVGLKTKGFLNEDNYNIPWNEGEDKLSPFNDEDEDIGQNFEFEVESSGGQRSPGSDTGISSGASPPQEMDPRFEFSEETRNLRQVVQKARKSTNRAKSDDNNDAQGSLSKNAIAARENRMKKKKYVQELEQNLRELMEENENLKSKASKDDITIESLSTENDYLRNVLANVEVIKGLVKSVSDGPCGSKLVGSSLLKRRQNNASEEALPTKMCKSDNASGVRKTYGTRCRGKVAAPKEPTRAGVCFHVNNNQMSLEFCSHCNVLSKKRTRPSRKATPEFGRRNVSFGHL